jgi:hypothetical protein
MGIARGNLTMQLARNSALTSPEVAAPDNNAQEKNDDDVRDEIDFANLRSILSASVTQDAYCRSPTYYDFTGRGKGWTLKCTGTDKDCYLILVPHPNIPNALLVFFPFVSTASELIDQIKRLGELRSFLSDYKQVLLARIEEKIAGEVLARNDRAALGLEHFEEKKLDWIYPSYDVCVESLLNPQGPQFSVYRNKISKFRKQGITVVSAREMGKKGPKEFCRAVLEVNKNWIRTKVKGGILSSGDVTESELKAPYRALIRASKTLKSDIDGIFLKREDAYIAFSLWETPSNWDTAPSFASMTSSYEPGLSEYLYRCTAERVKDRYRYICVGGSETASLDRFKRKFAPVKARTLRTIEFNVRASWANTAAVVVVTSGLRMPR